MTGLLRARGQVVMAGTPSSWARTQIQPRGQARPQHQPSGEADDLSHVRLQSQFEEYGGYDQRCITKLVKETSGPTSSSLCLVVYYNNELEACADPMVTESCLVSEACH